MRGEYDSPSTEAKVYVWIVFTVFFVVAPFAVEAMVKKEGGLGRFLSTLFLKREIYIVCAAVIADAFGGLLLSLGRSDRVQQQVLLGACFVWSFVSTALYIAAPQSWLIGFTAFLVTCIIALACKTSS